LIASDASAQLPHGIPDFCSNTTAISVKNGSWSDPTTWSIGQVPAVNERVAVTAGTTVTYDLQSDADLACVNVFGQLTFRPDIPTRLTVGTLTIMPGGGLQIGSSGAPVAAGVTAEIVIANRPIETGLDPEQFGTGLLGLGRVTMHGATKSPTFVRLAAEVHSGQSSLPLSTGVSGWQPGDRLVVPGTNQSSSAPDGNQNQWETPTMSFASGTHVGLATPLAHAHAGGRDASGNLMFLPHVGNISRNVIVRSLNPNGTRGHVLLTHRAEVDIRYAAFKDLGRTTIAPLDSTVMSSGHASHIGSNQTGRYSLHLHHLFGPASPIGGSHQYVLIGNAIDGGTKWGITVHNTHYGLVQDNVIYNAAGAGIMTEDGSETANLIQNNFIVRSWGTGDERADGRQHANDWGWEGTGIWLRGPDNYVRNNVVANVNSFAVTYMMLDVGSVRVPNAPGADPSVSGHTVNMMAVPLREFSSNEFYGAHRGITVWNLGARCCTEVFDVPVSTFHNTRMWHVGVLGFYGYGENRVTFDGWVHFNDPSPLGNHHENSTSLFFGDYIARNIVIRNANIQGLRIGVRAPMKPGDIRDIYGHQPGSLLVENSTLKNFWNIYTSTPYGVTGGGSFIPPRLVIARNVQFSSVAGSSPLANQAHVFRNFTPKEGENQNVLVSDRVVIESFDGNPGDNFEVFGLQQAASFVIPSTGITSHLAGLSNSLAWVTNGVAISGGVAPCSTTRGGIVGYVCPAGALPFFPPAPSSPFPMPPGGGGHTCAIADPFASLGGGTCVNGDWYPPGLAPTPGPGTPNPQLPTPSPGDAPCTTPDPFSSLGGGTCSNGNWYPPGMFVPPPAAGSPGPGPTPPPPPPFESTGCLIPDPFVSLGGGTCVNGNWYPPNATLPSPSPSTPAPPPPSTPEGCVTSDPFVSLGGGTCVNGNWLPPGLEPTSMIGSPSVTEAILAVAVNETGGNRIRLDITASTPQEHAEFMVAVFQHMQTRYGFVPDSIDVIQSASDVNGWQTVSNVGKVILAVSERLQAAGFRVPQFSSSSKAGSWSAAIGRFKGR
jgi:G8 domain/Right handed beta helix region